MKYILPVLFLLTSFNNFGQTPIKFRKVIGNNGYDYGYSAKQTIDSGYIVGGSTTSFGNGNNDMYLLKTNKFGVPTMQNTFGGINVDIGKCVRQTTDKGYILVGYTNSYGAGGYDVYVVKTDSMLQTQWTKTYGGSDWDFGNCIEQTTDKGYIICGSTYSYGKGNADYYLIKTDSLGDTIWTKTFGDSLEDVANSVIQTTDGGYAITGTTKSMGDTLGDIYTIKTNVTGDTIWTNKFGLTGYLDYGNDILESRYGGYLLGGETQSMGYTLGDSDGILVKLSSSGQTDSSYSTGYGPIGFNNVESITEDTSGKVAMVGRDVAHSDSQGNVHLFIIRKDWSYYNGSTFGGNKYDIGYSIENTSDLGYIICGYTESFNNNLPDIYLIKVLGGSGSTNFATIDSNYITKVNEYLPYSISASSFYPNPASTFTIINLKNNLSESTVEIYNLLGEVVKQITIKNNLTEQFKINLEDLNNGIYIVKLINKNNSYSQKLIIQH